MRVKYLKKSKAELCGIHRFPSFHHTGSIWGMKHYYYGKNALLVRSGQWIYNVTSCPDIYHYLAK